MGKYQPKISVIIPVYGVEKYIRQCLDSVINQTYKNLEIIIVNDGTKDNSMKIVEEYLDDERIKVINKENGGLSSARNRGMGEATGEYISFVDSDDWLEINIYQEVAKILEKDDEIIVFNYNRYSQKYDKYRRKILKLRYLPNEILFRNLNGECWNKIYKRSFLIENKFKFYEGVIYEDIFWEIETIHLVKKIKFLNYCGYNYRYDREGSIINTLNILDIRKSYLKVIEKVDSILNNNSNFNLTKLQKKRLKLFRLELDLKLKEKVKFEELKEKLNEYIYEDINDIKFIRKDIQNILKIKSVEEINLFELEYWRFGIYSLKMILKLKKRKLN